MRIPSSSLFLPSCSRVATRRALSTSSRLLTSNPPSSTSTSTSTTPTDPSPSSSSSAPAQNAALESAIPLLTSLRAIRAWRDLARSRNESVGFVPTMGALHAGHLSLVRRSLMENDRTVLSIFVNPTQFAPHEDLDSYPRTLAGDLRLLSEVSVPAPSTMPSTAASTSAAAESQPQTHRSVSAIFLPSINDMYPSGLSPPSTPPTDQLGTFVTLPLLSQQMEGLTRPHFFRGVATVCTKLFNAVQPLRAYFGQKDIQQALLLRRMCKDLLMQWPEAGAVHIVPTERAGDGLALSSRNAYLSPSERKYATTLYRSLCTAREAWEAGSGRESALAQAKAEIERSRQAAEQEGVMLKLDYVEMNDPATFRVVDWPTRPGDGRAVILSGAMWCGRTRLIDNLILGDGGRIVC